MRTVFATCVALSSLAFIAGGCASQKAENERLLSDRNAAQAQYESEKTANAAAQAKIAELDKQVTALRSELDATKAELARTQTEGPQKLKDAEAAADKRVTEAKTKFDAAARASAEENKQLRDQVAKLSGDLTAARNSQASASATLSDKISALEKKIDDLTKENDTLKAAARSRPATQPAN